MNNQPSQRPVTVHLRGRDRKVQDLGGYHQIGIREFGIAVKVSNWGDLARHRKQPWRVVSATSNYGCKFFADEGKAWAYAAELAERLADQHAELGLGAPTAVK